MNDAWMTATPPDTLRLAGGADVPHAIGVRVFNYYDNEVGEIVGLAKYPQPDTSGILPGGVAWWIDFKADRTGRVCSLDGSRMCTIEHATRKGWVL